MRLRRPEGAGQGSALTGRCAGREPLTRTREGRHGLYAASASARDARDLLRAGRCGARAAVAQESADSAGAICGDGFQCDEPPEAPEGTTTGRKGPHARHRRRTRVAAKNHGAAHRGGCFFNFGGPGAPTVDFLQATAGGEGLFDALNERFDFVGVDPRGDGRASARSTARSTRSARASTGSRLTPLTLDLDEHRGRTAATRALRAPQGDLLSTSRRPTPPATWTCCARRSARATQLPRVLLRDAPRRHVRRMFPGRYRAWSSTAPRCRALPQRSVPSRATRPPPSSARSALLPGCAADQAACWASAAAIRKRPTTAWASGPTRTRSRPQASDSRAVAGDDMLAAPRRSVYAKQLCPS